MFEIGELVVYGNTGVCRVLEIRRAAGDAQSYYVLQPLYQTCTISAPVASRKVFIRPVISREEAERLIDRIPAVDAEPCLNRSIQQLTEHYKAAIDAHRCEDLIRMTKSIYRKRSDAERQKRKLGVVDERFMKRAEELLFGELAAALEIPMGEVQGYIARRLECSPEHG